MINFDALRVFSPGYQATEWGFDYSQIVDLDTALAQPHRIAVMPVFYSDQTKFEYNANYCELPLDKFDLVLFTDIEWHSQTELLTWIETTGIQNWCLHVAGLWLDEQLDARTVYRPAWSFNFLRWNPPRIDFPLERPYNFDCLLGARREHRDFVMLSLQGHSMLSHSITTYRDIFPGHWIDQTPHRIAKLFPDINMQYPYVSDNLNPAWEVQDQLNNAVSGIVPWEIYNRTWFSVVCETLSSGQTFLSAEKMGKCFQARRLFVVFGIQNFLQQYHDWGFETFGDVIDESYDTMASDVDRWTRAFDQVRALCVQDLPLLLAKLKPRLDHNHHRLYALEQQKRQEVQQKVLAYLK
jgi:hypothetical protein